MVLVLPKVLSVTIIQMSRLERWRCRISWRRKDDGWQNRRDWSSSRHAYRDHHAANKGPHAGGGARSVLGFIIGVSLIKPMSRGYWSISQPARRR
jgi:hypothetical protein